MSDPHQPAPDGSVRGGFAVGKGGCVCAGEWRGVWGGAILGGVGMKGIQVRSREEVASGAAAPVQRWGASEGEANSGTGRVTKRSAREGNARKVRILGIDPGLRLTGYGAIDYRPGGTSLNADLIDAGVVRLDGKTPMPDRLVVLERELSVLMNELSPEVVAVEMLYSNYAHPRTAILMAHARGVILLCAKRHGARVEQLPATRIKQSLTGFGQAKKGAMQRAIQSYWKLPRPPEPPDVADALAVALCCGRAMDGAAR